MKLLGVNIERNDSLSKRFERHGNFVAGNLTSQNTKLKADNKKLKAQITELEEQAEVLQARVDVLEQARDDAREIVKLKLDAEEQQIKNEAVETRLNQREQDFEAETKQQYENGYADGVADGLRKVTEITEKDRENAMKIAAIAAASHNSPENVKALTNAGLLTDGKK